MPNKCYSPGCIWKHGIIAKVLWTFLLKRGEFLSFAVTVRVNKV